MHLMNDHAVPANYNELRKGAVLCCLYPFGRDVGKIHAAASAQRDCARRRVELRLDDYLFPYQGCVVDKRKYVWGVYGESRRHAPFKATQEALSMQGEEESRDYAETMIVEVFYRPGQGELGQGALDEAGVRATGFMNVNRLRGEFRKELRAKLIEIAARRYARFSRQADGAKRLHHLLLDYPDLVEDIFEMDLGVRLIVHPVRPQWKSWSTEVVQICTMRRIPERFAGVRVKFLPQIRVVH